MRDLTTSNVYLFLSGVLIGAGGFAVVRAVVSLIDMLNEVYPRVFHTYAGIFFDESPHLEYIAIACVGAVGVIFGLMLLRSGIHHNRIETSPEASA